MTPNRRISHRWAGIYDIRSSKTIWKKKAICSNANTIPQSTVMKQGIVLYAQHASRISSHRLACCNFSISVDSLVFTFSLLFSWTYALRLWSRIFLVFHYRLILLLFFFLILFFVNRNLEVRLSYFKLSLLWLCSVFYALLLLENYTSNSYYNEVKKYGYTNVWTIIYLQLDTLSESYSVFPFSEKEQHFPPLLSIKVCPRREVGITLGDWTERPEINYLQPLRLNRWNSRRFTV